MTLDNSNIQNRKLKKQILNFFGRLGFGAVQLPLSGRIILVMTALLFISLFLPWLEIKNQTQGLQTYGPFSQFLGYIGLGILLSVIVVPFFLLSHTKKEQIRSYVPFRLSDTQAVVFVSTMILVAIIQLLLILPAYTTLGSVDLQIGFQIAGASVVLMIICGFFLSRRKKSENLESYYLDHHRNEDFWEYTNIIRPDADQQNERKKQNMSLPF